MPVSKHQESLQNPVLKPRGSKLKLSIDLKKLSETWGVSSNRLIFYQSRLEIEKNNKEEVFSQCVAML
jgi:hypothetical protein